LVQKKVANVNNVPLTEEMETQTLKYIELIYDEANVEMRKFIDSATKFSLSDPSSTIAGFTHIDTRYRVYPTRKEYENKPLRELFRCLDKAKGAVDPRETRGRILITTTERQQ